jgi:hypothetical protein
VAADPKFHPGVMFLAATGSPPATSRELDFRHGHWKVRREKIRQAMISCNTNEFTRYRYDNCGGEAYLMWSPSEKRFKVAANYCKSRHCEPCQRAKALLIAANLRRRLEARPIGHYRHTVLTLAHSTAPLADQVKRLYACFKKLRSRPVWKTQAGGAFFCEVKIGEDGLWHPHLHIVSEGHFLPHRQLSDTWLQVTGDSLVVHVGAVDGTGKVCYEVTKYITKGTSGDVWDDPDRAQEWICASKGIRCCATFGSWRGFRLLQLPADPGDWMNFGRLETIIDRARAGEPWAAGALLAVRKNPAPPDTS